MNKNSKPISFKILLTLVLLSGFFLRIWDIGNIPPSPSLDEVAIGYNAYSILKTGADEYGAKYPLILRAYDDWRPALYVYLVIPFVRLLGLNVVAVRLPSVILSIFSILGAYYLVRKLFEKDKNSNLIALFTAFLFAVSPWHIYISRLGHEANAALAFLILGMACLFYKRNIVGIMLATLSFMSYQSEKIIIPIILIIFTALFWKKLRERKISFLIGFLFVLPILIPFLKSSLTPVSLIRFQATNIFSAEHEKFEKRALKLASALEKKDILGQILNNRRLVAFEIVSNQYLSHFKPAWLFSNTGREPHKVPNLGLLYVWESVLILFGLTYLYKAKIGRREKAFIIFWFLSAPIPAAITTDAPHAMRSYTFLPILQILGSCGLVLLLNIAGKYKRIIYLGFFSLALFSFFSFYKNYFIIFPEEQSDSFQYALSRAIPYVLENEDKYEKIIISNRNNLYQSYMFFLFFSQYDPVKYLKEGGTISGGYAKTHKIGKYEFRPIEWSKEDKSIKTLFVGNQKDFPNYLESSHDFYNLNNLIGIKALEI